jgi:hypothetical protein
MTKRTRPAATMTETEFENGYRYATEPNAFAAAIGIPLANKLRKDDAGPAEPVAPKQAPLMYACEGGRDGRVVDGGGLTVHRI